MGKIIQIDYDAVETTAQQLDRQVDQVRQLTASIRLGVSALENGGWEGIAAQAFLSEMECDILPALNRLSNALDSSRSHVLMTRDRFRSAEEQAARYFMGESQAVAPLRQGRLGEVMTPDWVLRVIASPDRLWDVAQAVTIFSHMSVGSAYAGEIILRGSRTLKTTLMGLDSGYITHIRADHLVDEVTGVNSHLSGIGAGVALFGLAVDWVQDYEEYSPRGAEYVGAAMVADTAQTVVSWAAAAKGAAAGAAIGSLAGPAGTVVGGLVGGIAGGLAVDLLWEAPLVTVGETTYSLDNMATEGIVLGGRAVADTVSDAASTIGTTIQTAAAQFDRLFAPGMAL